MDVVNESQAKIAEESGACAVMALEKVPHDIRMQGIYSHSLEIFELYFIGGIARMADPQVIKAIKNAVSIPVMAKCRIGHFVEAQVLEQLQVDFIDESEVLTPADTENYIKKTSFKIPFVSGCRNLGEALRRINEGAAMIRTKGEAGTGDVSQAVVHVRTLHSDINALRGLSMEALEGRAKEYRVPLDLLKETADLGRLPVVTFAAGGIATPADAALMMQLGMDGVFVGSGIFKSQNPKQRAHAIVSAVSRYNDPKVIAEVSSNLGEAMPGISLPK